ncbi:Mini-ribonuclease 3 [Alicyclobacillus dauci]|uniref:Mini-ribonuclease 3 n=1 Tax=Alicyclobacillus dauci TaxID=1475485 RepID=A0ABY6Z3B6_9BACL|nr:ribonuclease III domain-containing protein [Alicyclobacillus dauci]WAH37373.1 ribonuclease III [Alicyclobacillus dauci]
MKQEWKAEELSSVGLAFVGDAIWEIYARQHCLNKGVRKPNDLHKLCTKYVSARAQASALSALMPALTDAEAAIVRRGRNAKSAHVRRNVDVLVYRHSTAFESLIGYLHGTGQRDRLEEIVSMALQYLDDPEKESQK